MSINHNLKEFRKKAGLTQEEVAEKVNVTRQAISSYESGRTRPDIDMLMALAGVYGVDITDILYGREMFGRKRRIANIVGVAFLSVLFLTLVAVLLLDYLAFTKYAVLTNSDGMILDMDSLDRHIYVVNLRSWIAYIRNILCTIGCISLAIVYINPRYRPSVKQGVISFVLFCAATAASTFIFIRLDNYVGWGNYVIFAVSGLVYLIVLFIYWCVLTLVKWIKDKRKRPGV